MLKFKMDIYRPSWIDDYMKTLNAWRLWEVASCEEFNGAHAWVMTLYNCEEDAVVEMACENCPVGIDDVLVDGHEYLYGDMHGWSVEYGHHSRNDIEDFLEIPVNVKIIVEKYGPNLDMIYPEFDVWLEITPRRGYTGQ